MAMLPADMHMYVRRGMVIPDDSLMGVIVKRSKLTFQ